MIELQRDVGSVEHAHVEPSGKLNPIEQCFRCGFNICDTTTKKGILLYGVEDVLRYGPGFSPEKYDIELGDIDEDNIVGQPIMTCSANCALDSLSLVFATNPEQFTVHTIVLSAAYNVQIPGIGSVKQYMIDPHTLNNDINKLKRWGGTLTYEEYRKQFICPPHIDIDKHIVNEEPPKVEEPNPVLTVLESDSESAENDSIDVIDTIGIMKSGDIQDIPDDLPELEGDDDSDSETDSESGNIEIEHGAVVPDDEDIATDPIHNYVEDTDYLENEDPEADDGDFDFIPTDMQKLFKS
jgi:hypothetical protein